MVEDRIGFRYAKALFEQALEKGALEEVYGDLNMIEEVLDESRELRRFLFSPVVSRNKKEIVVRQLFYEHIQSMLTRSLTRLLADKHREGYLYYVIKAFRQLYDQHKGIIRGSLISASELSKELRNDIFAQVQEQTGKTPILEESIDPDLIGGFVLNVGDRRFDGSVSGSLRKIKQNIT